MVTLILLCRSLPTLTPSCHHCGCIPGARRRWSSTGKRTWCGRTWCSSAVVVNGEADLVRATPSPRRHSSRARKHLGDGGCVPAVAARVGEMWGGRGRVAGGEEGVGVMAKLAVISFRRHFFPPGRPYGTQFILKLLITFFSYYLSYLLNN